MVFNMIMLMLMIMFCVCYNYICVYNSIVHVIIYGNDESISSKMNDYNAYVAN